MIFRPTNQQRRRMEIGQRAREVTMRLLPQSWIVEKGSRSLVEKMVWIRILAKD
jgi:hypothetical protein